MLFGGSEIACGYLLKKKIKRESQLLMPTNKKKGTSDSYKQKGGGKGEVWNR